MIGSVEHMAIAAKDTAGLARWYVENLGFEVVVDGGPKGIWFVGPPGQGATLEIIPASDAARVEEGRDPPLELGEELVRRQLARVDHELLRQPGLAPFLLELGGDRLNVAGRNDLVGVR